MNRTMLRILSAVFTTVAVIAMSVVATAADYLPLSESVRWVLKNPSSKTPVMMEIAGRQSNTYRVRFSSPWGANDWDLESRGGKIYLTGYGQNGHLAPLGQDVVYFDFTAKEGASWKNAIGTMTVSKTQITVAADNVTYQNCIQIRQASGGSPIYYTFAPDVGFVQFGDGKSAFTIDVKDSSLPRSTPGGNLRTDDRDRPVQHVPGTSPPPSSNTTAPRRTPAAQVDDDRPLRVGITTSTFANEAQTPENLLKRFESTVDAGITFVSAAQNWTEIEPRPGQYNFGGLEFQVAYAERLNVPMSCTLRIVDTVSRIVPGRLMKVRWTDPAMEKRVMSLIDAMVPRFRGRVKWFMFGNEIDGYFGRHPDEIKDFAALYTKVAARVKGLSPETQVSSTLMYGGIGVLGESLRPLDDKFDFLAFTYYPIRGDFTMRPPDAPYGDFTRMRETAGGRKVILQEIGYASSALNGSSQEMQASFYSAVFDALRQNRDLIEAGNFFLLADLPDALVKDLGKAYGLNAKVFLAFLQTVGMFDLQGKPKKSWEVFRKEAKRAG